MSDLSNLEKRQLESMLQMGSGYVLNFSNRTFAEFIEDSVGLEAYSDKYGKGSKASVLREIWKLEPNHVVGKNVLELIDFAMEVRSEIDDEQYTKCRRIADRLLQSAPVINIDCITAKSAKQDFAMVAKLVKDAIDKNEPETGLDRLHTFMVKYFRILCEKHDIATEREKPLHSIAGEYIKFLKANGFLHSEMRYEHF